MLHIHCGDSSAEALKAGGIHAPVVVWSELLWAGPLRNGISYEDFLSDRALHLSRATGGARSRAQCAAHLRKQDDALRAAGSHDDIVLWFDACLYDQLILVRILDLLSAYGVDSCLWLICIGEHPAVPRFRGLGELTPDQLVALLPERRPVTAEQVGLARRTWEALCNPTPEAIQALIHQPMEALPYLRDALERLLQELPGVGTGLGRLQREVLSAVACGVRSLGALFCAVSDLEARPFFGDTSLWECVNGLAGGSAPALVLEGPGPLPQWGNTDLGAWRVAGNDRTLKFLRGRADYIQFNGLDRWIGGTHLDDPSSAWRWDPVGRCAVTTGT